MVLHQDIHHNVRTSSDCAPRWQKRHDGSKGQHLVSGQKCTTLEIGWGRLPHQQTAPWKVPGTLLLQAVGDDFVTGPRCQNLRARLAKVGHSEVIRRQGLSAVTNAMEWGEETRETSAECCVGRLRPIDGPGSGRLDSTPQWQDTIGEVSHWVYLEK